MSDLYKKVVKDGARLSIYNDTSPESPREWDNIGTMICFHNRYSLGDKHKFGSTPDFFESLAMELGMEVEEGYGVTDTQLNEIKSKIVILGLFLYDHSGITMSTTPFSCRWDSGQVGFIYVTHDRIFKEYGDVTINRIEDVKQRLESEVKVYDQYLRGEVYGFKLEKAKKCECCNHVEWEEIDSCWGFYGDDIKDELLCHVEDKYKPLVNML